MAFEHWCFNLFAERYPGADNELEESIIRGDDAIIDVVFESKETGEIYILQCKHPKISAMDPIAEPSHLLHPVAPALRGSLFLR